MKKYLATAILLLTIVINSKAQVELNSGGTGAAYTLSVPGTFSLRNGIQVTFKAHANSSAAATMNVSGTGAVSIMKDGGSSSLTAGDIKNGQIVTLAYDGAKWQMMNPVGTPTAPTNYWSPNGSDIFNNNAGNVGIGTTPATKLDVANSTLPTTSRFSNTFSSAGSKMAVYGWATGGSTGDNMAGAFDAYNSTGTNFAVYGAASGNFGNKTAIFGNATGTGGTNTAGYFSASGGTNNYAIIVPSTGGNVGIGTTSPAQKLEVQDGHILLSNTSTQSELRFKEASANGGNIISFKAPALLGSNVNYTLPDNVGAANDVLTNDGTGTLSWATVSSLANAWSLTGNSGTSPGTNFIGTTDAAGLDFRTNNLLKLRLTEKGQLEFYNTGTSLFIGEGAGANDDLNNRQNVFVGHQAGEQTIDGNWNTALGYGALVVNTNGTSNTAIGRVALSYSKGNDNTATGTYSLFWGTSGSGNTATGAYAGQTITTGDNNTFLGYLADATIDNLTNATAIGYNAKVSQSNSLILGNGANVGIGTSSPSTTLHVQGGARITNLVGPGTVITDASGNLSVAAGTTITGSGTTSYLARWTPSGSQLGIGATFDNGTNVGIGTAVPAKVAGSNRYLTVSATDVGTTNATASVELVGNAGALNTMATKIDFIGITPITDAIYTRARIEARTGNGATGHGQLLFYTFNGTFNEAMRIRESGHIGIGGSPGVVGSPLSVGASSQFQINSTGDLIRINNVPYSWPAANGAGFLSNNGSGTLTWSSAGVLAGGTTNYVPKWTSANSLSSTSLIFDNGTVVGIGTATPSATRLNIHTTSGAGNLRLTSAATLQTANDGFSMSNDGSNIMYMTQHENDDWYFNTNGGTLGIAIKPTGNVGIGTIAVNNKLDVEGAAVIGANYSGTNTAPSNGLLVEGNVGIGTTSSSAKTTIYGSTDPLLLLDGPVGAQSPLVFATAGTNKWAWYVPSGAANLALWHYGAPSQNYINFDGTNGHVNIAPTAGNVGVGVIATPSEKLEVAGNVEITSATNQYMINNARALNMDGTQNVFVGDNAAAGSYSTIIGYQAGNVNTGISNTFVGRQSGLANSSGGQNAFFGINSGSGNTTGQYNTFIGRSAGGANTTGSYNTILGGTADLASGALTYATAIGYGATIGQSYGMALGGTGANALEVGIGVNNNMAGKLHVYSSTATYNISGTDYNSAVYGEVAGAIHSSRGIMGVSWATGNYGIGAYGSAGGAAVANYGVYGNATGATTNYAGYFDAGNVFINNRLGINDPAPLYELDVSSTTATYAGRFRNTGTGSADGLRVEVNTTAVTTGTRYGTYSIVAGGLSTNYGVLGIAQTSGTTNYGVYGSASGGSTNNYGLYCAGSGGYTGTWTLISDQRFKENIKPLTGALEKILQLEPKTYNLKSREYEYMNFPTGTQIGLISQEVEKIIPELVEKASHPGSIDEKTGEPTGAPLEFKSMNYIGLTPVLVQAIKEQQLIIEQLKARIEALEKK